MIDWWAVAHNALWIVGLAVGLAALSVADFESQRAGRRRREVLGRTAFQVAIDGGLALCCVGLLFGGQAWWARAVWGLLAALFAGLATRAGWQGWAGRRDAAMEGRSMLRPYPYRWAGVALVVVAGLGVWGALAAKDVVDHARSLQAHLGQLQAMQAEAGALGGAELAVAAPDSGWLTTAAPDSGWLTTAAPDSGWLTRAGQHLAGMNEDLQAIEGQVGPFLPLGRLLGWVPGYGGDLAAAPDLLAAARGAASAGDRIFQALAPGLALLGDGEAGGRAGSSLGERLLPVLAGAGPELQRAREELAAVEAARSRIDAASLSPKVAGLVARLDGLLPWLETGVDGALLAPGLLGAEGPRTYLVVAQNNQELRPTGGFISGVGEMRVEAGRIGEVAFRDSYAVDNLEVPHELTPADFQAALGGQLWFFRDANWDADFPTSARRMVGIYAQDQGVEVDGVVALDLTVLPGLVAAVGPIEVAGIDGPVTAANVVSVIQAEWGDSAEGGGGEWWLHRKDFMGEIAGAVMDRLTSGEGVDAVRLARALKAALDEKHLLIYLADPGAAEVLHQRGWDGAQPDRFVPGDSLQVVDTNVGFNKVDANVARSLHYAVDLRGEPRARLTLGYENHSRRAVDACVQEARYGDTYADMMDRCYWDYVRVYGPAGSELVQGPGLPLPPGSLLARQGGGTAGAAFEGTPDEEEGAMGGAFFALVPGGAETMAFDYRLPAAVLSRDEEGRVHYRLAVQKQAGTEAVPLVVEIVLPVGAEIVRAGPGDWPPQVDGVLTIATDLRIDREFEIVYRSEEREP